MNKTIREFSLNKIKEGLGKLTDSHRLRFKRMYSSDDLNKDINKVIDNMPDDKLDWALTQVENSVEKDINNK